MPKPRRSSHNINQATNFSHNHTDHNTSINTNTPRRKFVPLRYVDYNNSRESNNVPTRVIPPPPIRARLSPSVELQQPRQQINSPARNLPKPRTIQPCTPSPPDTPTPPHTPPFMAISPSMNQSYDAMNQ